MQQRAAQWALGAERMTDAITATPLDSLFAPLQIGALTLPNRVVMAPLTRARASADVKALTLKHVADLEVRIAELAAMRDTLRALAESCSGDDRPDCPILADMASAAGDDFKDCASCHR